MYTGEFQWLHERRTVFQFCCWQQAKIDRRMWTLLAITATPPPCMLPSYLHLSFRISTFLNQPPIVCLTKRHLCVPFA